MVQLTNTSVGLISVIEIIIFFVIWYYWSNSFIVENVKESCRTGIDKSSSIFWGVFWRNVGTYLMIVVLDIILIWLFSVKY